MPWYEALGGAFERALTIPFHMACSALVMASLRRHRAWPFVLAFIREVELAAMSVPFTVLVLRWARSDGSSYEDDP